MAHSPGPKEAGVLVGPPITNICLHTVLPYKPHPGGRVISEKDLGDDNISGGAGLDRLFGGYGSDDICGGANMDILWGGPGGDYLIGGAGNDSMFGGSGNDVLNSQGTEEDELNCGKGFDLAITDEGDTLHENCERRELPPPEPPATS